MKIKKKILLLAIGPVLLLGIVTMALTLTMMRGSMLDEIQAALKGTAAATLAAYDQNAGQYVQSTNGYVWKGNYNVSKSGSLVDRIKENTGMDVTFFYGKTRIMTSAKDKNGARVLRSEVGEAIVKQVLQGKKEYFSDAVRSCTFNRGNRFRCPFRFHRSLCKYSARKYCNTHNQGVAAISYRCFFHLDPSFIFPSYTLTNLVYSF